MFHVEQSGHLPSLLQTYSKEIGISLTNEHIDLFLQYLKELQTWNRSFNLTSITSDEGIILKHFVDSLAALVVEPIPLGSRLLDVGTGAGFPGIPLKIARPDLSLSLIEPSHKKSAFLRYITGRLRLENMTLFDGTFSQYVRTRADGQLFDYITTRALKHELVLQDGPRVVHKSGKIILYSSQPLTSSDVDPMWKVTHKHVFQLPQGYGQRVISVLSVGS